MAATAVFDADDSQYQEVASRIIAVLEKLERIFAAKDLKVRADGSQVHSEVDRINARFAEIAAQARQTGGAFGYIAGGAAAVVTSVGAIASAVTRLVPLIKYIPDSFAAWVPAVKQAAAEHEHLASVIGVVSGAANALRGRLSAVDALFIGMNARGMGASKTMATFGAVGAFATSKVISGVRGVGRALGSLLGQIRNAIIGLVTLGGAAGGSMMPFAVGGLGAAAAIGGLAAGIYRAMDAAGTLLDQSFNTGAAVRDVAILTQEFKNAGKAGEDITPVLSKMHKALESGSANAMIADLGLDLEQLRSQTPVEQFHALGAAINGLADPSERSAAAMAIFGKSGASLLSMFASKGFGDAAAQVGRQAELLQKNAALFDDVSDKLGLAGVKTQGFFIGVADKVVPVLKPLLDRFAALDLSALGQQVGDLIAMTATAIGDGRIAGVLMSSIAIALAETGNFLLGMVLATGPVMRNALLGAATAFIAAMLAGVARVLDALANVPGLGKTAIAANAVRGVAAGVSAAGADNFSVSEALASGMARGRVMNTDGMRLALGAQVAGILASTKAQQDKAVAEVPTITPTSGPQVLGSEGAAGRGFSALQQIGGAFGRGAGTDPMVEANRLAREGNNWLKMIAMKVGGRETKDDGGVYA